VERLALTGGLEAAFGVEGGEDGEGEFAEIGVGVVEEAVDGEGVGVVEELEDS